MSSIMRFDTWQNPAADKEVSFNNLDSLVNDRGDKAYAQVNKVAGQTMNTGFDTILLDNIVFSKNISLVGNQIQFQLPGVYHVNVGWRFGTAADAWTTARLWNTTTGEVGISYGTGNVTNDPGPAHFNFLANITNVSVNYSLQTYRTATMAVTNVGIGYSFAATIIKVS